MSEERKHALLLAATVLAVRKLAALENEQAGPARVAAVENAISQAKFILDPNRQAVAERMIVTPAFSDCLGSLFFEVGAAFFKSRGMLFRPTRTSSDFSFS